MISLFCVGWLGFFHGDEGSQASSPAGSVGLIGK